MMIADLAIVTGSSLLAYWLRNSVDKLLPMADYTWPFIFLLVVWGACLAYSGMYESFRLKKVGEVLFIIYQSIYIGFFVFAGLCYLFHIVQVSRSLVVLTFIFSAIGITIQKLTLMAVFRWLRKKGLNFRNVLIVGTGPRAQRLIQALDHNKDTGLKIIGLLDQDAALVGKEVLGHKVLGTLAELPGITKANVVDEVFFVVPRSWLGQIEDAIQYLETLGVRVGVAVDYFNVAFARAKQTDLFDMPFMSFETVSDKLLLLVMKRFMDIVLSGLALLILMPLLLAVAVLIKLTSPGPVFFVQKRVSMNGRIFNLYKFRTMVKDAEAKLAELQHLNEMQGPVFKITKDPRITPLGAFLRKTSIDELPQFLNVWRGDMSLVGPRPPLPKEVEKYDDWQRRRLSMRPGITCLWQINGRNKITDFEEWAKLDLKYIDNWSLWLDLEILARTVPVVVFGVGAK
ncbi:MAG: sugar transferase [Candidatus Omnitrophica bacterium]|nr:sugar transferase [Candidatus Omnitrophota bacterium]